MRWWLIGLLLLLFVGCVTVAVSVGGEDSEIEIDQPIDGPKKNDKEESL